MSTNECNDRHSGFVRWWQLGTALGAVFGITVTVFLFEASAMITIDKEARLRDTAILETMTGIRSSLARIEMKLDIVK